MMRLSLAHGAVMILLAAAALADEPSRSDEPLRQQRLELMGSLVDKFRFEGSEEPKQELRRTKTPILRWSNPVRDFVNDGVIFLILDGQRPRAVVNAWVRSRDPKLDSGEMRREFVSLSAEPLICRRDDDIVWSPQTAGLADQPLADVPAPAKKSVARLAQMREIAREFQAATYKQGSPHELRLLTQPLYKYQDQAAKVLEGGLFAFVEGNDPEALLLLEAVSTRDGQAWRYTLARMTTFPVVVQHKDRDVFTCEAYSAAAVKREDPFIESGEGMWSLRE